MKKFCESLREDAMKMINFKNKKVKLLRKELQKSQKMKKPIIFVKKNLKIII